LSQLKNIIEFYRDCYQTDLKGIRIRNFMSKNCEKRFIPDNNEFFHQIYSGVPVNTTWAKDVEQLLFLNSKEKTLFAGSIFVRGTQSTLGREKSALVPLYIHELELNSIEEVYFLSIKETFFNPDFVELANNSDKELDITFDIISTDAPPDPFGFEHQVQLLKFMQTYFSKWDYKDIKWLEDPTLNFNKYFKSFNKKNTSSLKILSNLMIGIFKKPQGSLGVLNDLNHLAKEKRNSELLNQFFQIENVGIQNVVKRDIILPATLSKNQESAVYAADAYPITQIIGPPGTGKSYSISALAIDAVLNAKSVLIVSKNVQACKVVASIIESDFELKGGVIKAYNQVYRRSLISKLSKAIKTDVTKSRKPTKLAKKIGQVIDRIEHIENKILDIGNSEYKWGVFYSENQNGFFIILKDKWYQ